MGYVPLVSQIGQIFLKPETDYTLPELLCLSDGTKVVDRNA